jgi:sugar/nucleoside kinase (ribokinase family)
MNHVLIVGSMALDSVKTPFGEVPNALGGAAVYSSTAASFFTPVRIVGVVGQDFPQEHLDFLRSRRIDLGGVQITDGKTFRWSGYYEYDMNQAHTLDTQLNVFQYFKPHIPENYRDSEFVFLANIDPELQLDVLKQVRNPKLTVCDTMNFWINGRREQLIEVLKRVDIAIMNDAEARQLCDTPSIVVAARQILEMGPRYVVIKKGEYGAAMYGGECVFSAPPYPLEDVKDPTGAGDTFAGGFIGYLASTGRIDETALRQAVVYGSTLASYNVEDFSLERMKRLSRDEIQTRFMEFRDIAHFECPSH